MYFVKFKQKKMETNVIDNNVLRGTNESWQASMLSVTLFVPYFLVMCFDTYMENEGVCACFHIILLNTCC